jgi:hypothetical protein
MRSDRTRLTLVRAPSAEPDPAVEVVGGPNRITVHIQDLRPGQVCEVLHKGVFSLSPRIVVPEGEDSLTISTFALARGTYDVSLRFDENVEGSTSGQDVVVGRRVRCAG